MRLSTPQINDEMSEAEEPVEPIQERGPWTAKQDGGKTFVESADFTHDVRLYVDGDFATPAQKLAYAAEIARRLNAWSPDAGSISDPHEAALTETGYGLDAIGSLRYVSVQRKDAEPDADYRTRLIAKLRGDSTDRETGFSDVPARR
jgi:hypothetical protein